MLSLKSLSASIDGKEILKDISFDFAPGKIYAILGPNGSGKSTLGNAIMGAPELSVHSKSKIIFEGKNIKRATPDVRAKRGIFMTFQNPLPIPGVSVRDLLRLALEKKFDPIALHKRILECAKELKIKDELLSRSLNDGFSGGEKKKLEALQIALLQPKFALFDEIDTGVDIDALRAITNFLKKHLKKTSTLVFITHSAKLLSAIKPNTVLILKNGTLVKTGTARLIEKIEREGFEKIS